MSNIHPACKPVSEAKFNVLTVKVDKDGSKFTAKLHTVVQRPYTKEISLVGPLRDTRPEAIKDGMELGKRYVLEGEAGARTVLLRLKKRKWSPQDVRDVDEAALDGFVLPGLQGNQEPVIAVEEKLLPPGEGWCRYNEELQVHSFAVPPVYFATSGPRAGQYATGGSDGQQWEVVPVPHVPREHPVRVAAASTTCARKGGKLDRAVLLPDITRIARLALKMPLSFVDRPACAYAVFQGVRSAESAQWCAENFHKKLLQRLARKIHGFKTEELMEITVATLEELDEEILKSSHAFSGCSALIALILGDKLVVTGVGQVRAVLLPDGEAPRPLLTCTGSLESTDESQRITQEYGVIRGGLVYGRAPSTATDDQADDAARILSSPSAFDVLMIPEGGPTDERQVRTAYRKLALKVHPDKMAADGGDAATFKAAFARLDAAKDSIEAMLAKDGDACRLLCHVVRADAHTKAGAASLLKLGDEAGAADAPASVISEAERSCRRMVEGLAVLQGVATSEEYEWAMAACQEAVETLQRTCTPESLPRQEALLREGVPTGRALGVRDLRRPRPLVIMRPESASWTLPSGVGCRLAALSGSVASSEASLTAGTASRFTKRPRASALRWCLDAAASGATSGSAICVSLASDEPAASSMPAAKRPRACEQGPEGTVRVRHLLLRHRQLRPDPMVRREASRTAQEAEEAALAALEELLAAQDPDRQFLKLCRELSDCQSATQPGALAGDLGWLGRGQQEQVLEDAIWGLGMKEFSDVLTSSRGVHIIQRLA